MNTPKVFLLTRSANKWIWCFKQFFNSLQWHGYLLEKWQILCHTYAFPEINRAGNVRLVRYSLLYPLAGNVHRDTRTFTGCFASTRLLRVKNDPLFSEHCCEERPWDDSSIHRSIVKPRCHCPLWSSYKRWTAFNRIWITNFWTSP